jgi:hypothetical protein
MFHVKHFSKKAAAVNRKNRRRKTKGDKALYAAAI